MKKRLGALLCALVMCLALLSPASALEEVCFTSLNNKLLPLASDTMPEQRHHHPLQPQRHPGL